VEEQILQLKQALAVNWRITAGVLALAAFTLWLALDARGTLRNVEGRMAAQSAGQDTDYYHLTKSIAKLEGWERWIVKLQKQITETERARASGNLKLREYERMAENMAECMKRLAPLVNALQPDFHRPTSRPQEPTWEELTSRPVAPFASSVTFPGRT
jgi:hypothetical protein